MAVKAVNDALNPTPLFRPGTWLLLDVALCCFAWRRRDTPAGAFVLGICGSAVVYVMTFFAVGVATDLRYAYWAVLAGLIGGIGVAQKRAKIGAVRGAAIANGGMTGKPHPAIRPLRAIIVAGGLGASISFVIVGVLSRLQMYGDGSIFSYAVAARDAWAFHWHNISGRLFTYLFAYPLAEAVVAMSKSADAGIAVYGVLFFSGPLLGLALTFAIDRTPGRTIFVYACLSTVCLCPLVYGAPTEMWMAHAVFWPALAACLTAPPTWRGTVLVFGALLLLVFTHEGAIVLSFAILFALLLRGWRNAGLLRAAGAFLAVLLIWAAVKVSIRPDDYIAAVLSAAALRFIDIRNLAQPALLSALAALIGYGCFAALLGRIKVPRPYLCAAVVTAASLAVYWIWFDNSLLTEARYNLRTFLLIMIPAFGVAASVQAMSDPERRARRSRFSRNPPAPSRTRSIRRSSPARYCSRCLSTQSRQRSSFRRGWITRPPCARSQPAPSPIRTLAALYLCRRTVSAPISSGSHGIQPRHICRCWWRPNLSQRVSWSTPPPATFGFPVTRPDRAKRAARRFPAAARRLIRMLRLPAPPVAEFYCFGASAGCVVQAL